VRRRTSACLLLHMGIDVAIGPDDPVFYVVFGNAWLRP
jgi:hypothetical protein